MKGIYSKRTKQAVGAITLLALLAGVVALLPIKAHSDDLITEDSITKEAETYLPEGTICHRRNGVMECGIPDKRTGDLVWVQSEFKEEVASNGS
jgi:hypothetical protein